MMELTHHAIEYMYDRTGMEHMSGLIHDNKSINKYHDK